MVSFQIPTSWFDTLKDNKLSAALKPCLKYKFNIA